MKTAKEILNQEIYIEMQKLLLPNEIETKSHNGITYKMVNEEICLRAMEEYRNQFIGVILSPCCNAELIKLTTYGYDECIECGKTYKFVTDK